MPRVEVFGPLEWNFPVPIGYNSKLKSSLSYGVAGLKYLARPDNSVFRYRAFKMLCLSVEIGGHFVRFADKTGWQKSWREQV